MTSEQNTINPEALATLARLIYEEMDLESRQMAVASDIAREQWQHLRQVLLDRGLRRPDAASLEE